MGIFWGFRGIDCGGARAWIVVDFRLPLLVVPLWKREYLQYMQLKMVRYLSAQLLLSLLLLEEERSCEQAGSDDADVSEVQRRGDGGGEGKQDDDDDD